MGGRWEGEEERGGGGKGGKGEGRDGGEIDYGMRREGEIIGRGGGRRRRKEENNTVIRGKDTSKEERPVRPEKRG